MDKKKEFEKQFSLLCDVFKRIDPSFINILRRVTGKEEPEQIAENMVTKYCDDCQAIDTEAGGIERTDWNDCETAQNDCCQNAVDNDNEFDNMPEETTKYNIANGFYFSKIGLKVDDCNCTTLNVLYVADIDEFHKHADKWMSDAFENACMNNINDNMLYGHNIDYIHFDFYTREDYDNYKPEDNVLCACDWVWDPEMFTFFAQQESNAGPYRYVRMLIDTDIDKTLRMQSVHVIREEDSECEGGAIKIDYITPEQRNEFIQSMKAMKERNVKQDSDEDYDNKKVLSKEDFMESAKKCNDASCIVSISKDVPCTNRNGFIDMGKCEKCPEKNNCRPNITDYIGAKVNKGFKLPPFIYDNNEMVEVISDGKYSVADHTGNYAHKEHSNYWKGCIEKDISLDSQSRNWDMDDFLYFMSCAVRDAISNKSYMYYSDEISTVVAFNFRNIVDMYYKHTKENDVHDNKLGLFNFGDDTKEKPSVAILKEYMHELTVYLCDTFEFTNVSILKDTLHEDYLIICDY